MTSTGHHPKPIKSENLAGDLGSRMEGSPERAVICQRSHSNHGMNTQESSSKDLFSLERSRLSGGSEEIQG